MTRIVTAAQSLSNAIRAHNHPVLEPGNLSYPDGAVYRGLHPRVAIAPRSLSSIRLKAHR